MLTQYAMAPVILIRGTMEEWDIANLSTEAYRIWSAGNSGGFDVTPLRNGLYLLHRNRR